MANNGNDFYPVEAQPTFDPYGASPIEMGEVGVYDPYAPLRAEGPPSFVPGPVGSTLPMPVFPAPIPRIELEQPFGQEAALVPQPYFEPAAAPTPQPSFLTQAVDAAGNVVSGIAQGGSQMFAALAPALGGALVGGLSALTGGQVSATGQFLPALAQGALGAVAGTAGKKTVLGGQVVGSHRGFIAIKTASGAVVWIKRSRRSRSRARATGGMNQMMKMVMMIKLMNAIK